MTSTDLITPLFDLKTLLNKEFEKFRQNNKVKRISECKVILETKLDLSLYSQSDIKEVFGFPVLEIIKGEEDKISIEMHDGPVCPRCWTAHNYNCYDQLCLRCENVILQDFPNHWSSHKIKEYWQNRNSYD